MEEKGANLAQPQWTTAPAQQYPAAQQPNQGYPPTYQQNSAYPQALPQNAGYPPAAQQPNAPIPAQQYQGYLAPQPNVIIVSQESTYPTGQNVPLSSTTTKRRNKPQGNSVAPASLIFISGGMSIAWSFAFGSIFPVISQHASISWFIGGIIGAVLGPIAAKFVQKKFILISCAFLVILGGILFMAAPLNLDALLAARYLNGIANGLAFAPSLIMIGEEVVKENRGAIAASVEGVAVSTGIFVQLLFAAIWGFWFSGFNEFGATNVHGLFCIIVGVVAFFYALFFTIESPVFYLQREEEQAAIDCLRRLQQPNVLTQETYALLEENKRYVAENNEMSTSEAAIAGLLPLFKLCIYRGLAAMSFSYAMGTAIILGSLTLASSNLDFIWPYVICGGLRWISSLISMFIMDSAGRKIQMLVATFVCAAMAIGTGVIYDDRIIDLYLTAYFLFVFQFFAAAFSCSSSAYLTEAFPLAIKPIYLSVVFIVEMIVQVIVCVCFGSIVTVTIGELTSYFYALGAIGFVFFVFAFVCMPETKRDTLRTAQAKFRNFKGFN